MSGQLQLIPRRPPKLEFKWLTLEQLTGWQHARPPRGLVEQIRLEQAVMNPIQVFPTRGGKYTYGDGRRRTKAVAALVERDEWPTPARIPAVITTGPDTTRRPVRAAATLRAHGTRSASPASELAAIEAILDAAGEEKEAVTVREIERQTGISQATVRRRLRLRGLVAPLRAALDEGTLSASIAEAAVRLTEEHQQELARRLRAGERLTARVVRELARARTRAAAQALPDGLFGEPDVPWQLIVAGHLTAAHRAIPADPEGEKLAHAIAVARGLLDTRAEAATVTATPG